MMGEATRKLICPRFTPYELSAGFKDGAPAVLIGYWECDVEDDELEDPHQYLAIEVGEWPKLREELDRYFTLAAPPS